MNNSTKLDARSVRLEIDYLTRARYERARTHYGVVRDSEKTLGSITSDGDYVARDLFAGIFEPGSRVDSETDGTPVRRVLDWATESLGKMPEWRNLLNASRGNVISSALATEVLVDHLSALEWPTAPKADDAPDSMSKDVAGMPQSIEWSRDGATVTTTRDRNGKKSEETTTHASEEAAKKAVEAAKSKAASNGYAAGPAGPTGQAYAEAMEAFADSLSNDPSSGVMLRGAAAGAVRDATKKAEEIGEALAMTYGLDGDSEQLSNPDESALGLAESLASSPDLVRFLKLVGSMLDSMKSSPNRRRTQGNVTPYGIATTRDVRRLLPSELAMLGNPATEGLAMLRAMQGQALGWTYGSMGTKEAGPVFVALDLSGSMQGREDEAKAFAVASALHAADNGRDVSVATFTSRMSLVAESIDTPSKRASMVRDVLSRRASGGTDFRPVVNHAASLSSSTDVLLISDGVGAVDDDIARETFASRGLHYLVIGRESAVVPTLRDIAKGNIMTTDDITSGSATTFAAGAASA
jgi:uncharacterized protein with von Willebrand factor type A (vWA) domain